MAAAQQQREECPVIPPVTCPDGSTADSVVLCPPAKVVCDDVLCC
ncbi:hypothetical protein [Photobacterium leiognathi]|nr:hypothetical protein [Photobacterium leiognathi]